MKRAERTVDIEAPPEACFDALVDFGSYPRWQSAVCRADVLDDGDPVRVSFEIDAKVKKVGYVLDYHLDGPERLGLDPGAWVPKKVISVLRDQVMTGSVEELRQHVESR